MRHGHGMAFPECTCEAKAALAAELRCCSSICRSLASTLAARLASTSLLNYHITSHHITSHHITSHHITSHHITSHHITSHHITSHIRIKTRCIILKAVHMVNVEGGRDYSHLSRWACLLRNFSISNITCFSLSSSAPFNNVESIHNPIAQHMLDQ
jgi:hypothetical protein